MIKTIKDHLYITAAAGLAALLTVGAALSKTYSTLARAEVIEEQYIPQADKTKPSHYLLHLKILDEKNKGDVYTLQVVENKVPLAVLDALIGERTELYFPVWKDELVWNKPVPINPVGNFVQINSDEIRILHPWESSVKVRKEFENELATKRDQERRQAEWDSGTYFHGRMMY